jgi:hypothetical protein
MPPRKPHKKAPDDPAKWPKKARHLLEFFPVRDGNIYYRNVETPLEFLLLEMRDEGLPHILRHQAAVAAVPYMHPKVANRPYVPSPEEQKRMEDQNRLVIELVEYREISGDDPA